MTVNKKIKALIFDMGGVLVDLDLERCKRHFKADLGYEKIDEILDACHQRGIYSDVEEGLITADEFRAKILADSRPGCVPEDVDRAVWTLLTGIEPYKLEFLAELKKEYKLFMLSNNNPIGMARARVLFAQGGHPVDELFDDLFLSYQMKLQKPSLEIYRSSVEKSGFRADELLFIDDSMSNVQAAEKVGIHALLYVQGTDLRKAVSDKLRKIC